MINKIKITAVFLSFLLLCGFKSGVEFKDKKPREQSTGPIVEYEETISSKKSNADLYRQNFLLAVTSLEEAHTALSDNPQWSYRMAHNALRYVKLMKKLLREEHGGRFDAVEGAFAPLLRAVKRPDLSDVQVRDAQASLQELTLILKEEFNFDKARSWISE